jgi:nicotinate-nucleotide pyrophosphorylase (carboxylating)
MLSAERVFLNFLQRMSAIATMTSEYVELVRGTNLKIYDTRKTTPGMRVLEKYAVRCGGGCNHRMSLSDGVMLKDNHFAHIGSSPRKKLEELVEKSRRRKGVKYVCVEVDRLDQLETVLEVKGVDLILLDNMTCPQLREAVRMRDASGSSVELEASGGVTRKTLREIAETGVDRVSVGALTCSAGVVDLGLDETA